MYDLYKDFRRTVRGYKYFQEEDRQMAYGVRRSIRDLNLAYATDMIPYRYQNKEDMSSIANILLQGNTSGASEGIVNVAMQIAVKYSGTAENAFKITLPGGGFYVRESEGSLYEYMKEQYQSGDSNVNIEPTILWKKR